MKKSQKEWLKKHEKQIPFMILGFIFITLYLSGIIAQWSPASMFNDEFKFSFNPIKCIMANFTVSYGGLICVLVLYAVFGCFIYLKYKDHHQLDTVDDERGFKTETSGAYGTSYLMTYEEGRDFCEIDKLERVSGMILGKITTPDNPKAKDKIVTIPPDGRRFKYDAFGKLATEIDEKTGLRKPVREKLPKINGNRHVMVIGPSGSGKSFCFARPAIFQSILHGESIIVTDPKGELYEDTSKYAEKHGYTVKIFNLSKTDVSDSWNALAEVQDADIVVAAQNFCNIIIANTQDPNAASQPVYVDGPKNLLTALVLCVLQSDAWKGDRTLGGVYEMLCQSDDTIDIYINALPNGHPAIGLWNTYQTSSPNMKGNIKMGLTTRLQVLQSDVIKNITGVDDIDLAAPGKSKCAYYVIMDDMNSTYKFLSSLFFTCLFNKLVKYSRTLIGGRLPVPVNIIMDEFIAIGQLPDFDKKLATVRSAGISCSIIFQTLAQLQAAYPDGLWETLVSNCSTMLCLACNDMTTAQYLSDRSGTQTIALEQKRVDRPLLEVANIPSTVSHTYSLNKRTVMDPAEIMHEASEHKVVISIVGANLMLADQFPYTDMIDPNSLERINMTDHCPAWRTKTQYNINQRKQSFETDVQDGYVSKRGQQEQTKTDEPTKSDNTKKVEKPSDEKKKPVNKKNDKKPSSKPKQQQSDDDFEDAEDIEENTNRTTMNSAGLLQQLSSESRDAVLDF